MHVDDVSLPSLNLDYLSIPHPLYSFYILTVHKSCGTKGRAYKALFLPHLEEVTREGQKGMLQYEAVGRKMPGNGVP